VDSALILAGQILKLIRESGVSRMEAHAALDAAGAVLPTVNDISFRNDLTDASPLGEDQVDP